MMNMERDFYLNDKDRVILEKFQRACLDKRTADKIKAILLMAQGFTYIVVGHGNVAHFPIRAVESHIHSTAQSLCTHCYALCTLSYYTISN
jgi:hypothetical protein